jgi:hypothetical protein
MNWTGSLSIVGRFFPPAVPVAPPVNASRGNWLEIDRGLKSLHAVLTTLVKSLWLRQGKKHRERERERKRERGRVDVVHASDL